MKSIFKIGATVLLLFVATMGNAQMTKAQITATGLTCSMCSNAINKQLQKIAGVENVNINLNTNTFIVSLKNNNNLSPNDLKQAIEKAGFFVGSMVVSVRFDKQKISPNSNTVLGNWNLIFANSTVLYLDGDVDLKILNQGFVTQKEYKKWKKTTPFSKTLRLNKQTYFINLAS